MSGGPTCRCAERAKPLLRRRWVVIDRQCHHSAFAGYHYTPSFYSAIVCLACGRVWRTKAAYVAQLRDAPSDWYNRIGETRGSGS